VILEERIAAGRAERVELEGGILFRLPRPATAAQLTERPEDWSTIFGDLQRL
jgi:hypothetical protein